jgi:hypothetical protein
VRHLINLGADLCAAGIGLHIVEQGIDTEDVLDLAVVGQGTV